jgi:hypothetical protein
MQYEVTATEHVVVGRAVRHTPASHEAMHWTVGQVEAHEPPPEAPMQVLPAAQSLDLRQGIVAAASTGRGPASGDVRSGGLPSTRYGSTPDASCGGTPVDPSDRAP